MCLWIARLLQTLYFPSRTEPGRPPAHSRSLIVPGEAPLSPAAAWTQGGRCCLTSLRTCRVSVTQVRYWSSGDEESASTVTVAASETSATLGGLRSNLAHHAAVRAYNSAGAGPFSTTASATTRRPRA